jgi:hypothetical protein
MDDLMKKAKLEVLKDLRKQCMDSMGSSMKGGLNKVSVMAPDAESLKEGLEKAEDIVESNPMQMGEESEEMEDEEMSEESEDSESEEMSEEELDKKIQELMAKKSKIKKA